MFALHIQITRACFLASADNGDLNTNKFWVGLVNPTFATGNNAELNGQLKWLDGSDFTYDAALPEVLAPQRRYCVTYVPNEGVMNIADCDAAFEYSICEYECGNGEHIRQ